jgi:hypothetical protein
VQQAIGSGRPGSVFGTALHDAGTKHFGWKSNENVAASLRDYTTAPFLDLIEILAEEGPTKRRYLVTATEFRSGTPLPDFGATFNDLADRHRFGYRLEGTEAVRIASPALADAVLGPALFALQRAGWTHAEQAFREALAHQRGGADENDDALTAAAAALEAALKAAGIEGNNLGQLAANFKRSDLAARQLSEVPELLTKLLQRPAAIRNVHGDAHGKSPGEHPSVPQALVDLAVHLAGSFMVYIEAQTRT